MNSVIVMIIIAALLFGGWLVQRYMNFSNQQGNVEITLHLPATFYIKQVTGLLLLLVAIFLIALDPVPAGIAINAAVGLTFNLFFLILWHSIHSNDRSGNTLII